MKMEKRQMGGSSTSFTDLFGPRDSSSSSSTGVFGSVLGPSSTGLQRDSSHSHSGIMCSTRKQDPSTQHINSKHSTAGKVESQRPGSKEKGSYQCTEKMEPCYLSSSIYYGGQEVYSYPPTRQPPVVMKEDPNQSDASRGNWWQGSLYY